MEKNEKKTCVPAEFSDMALLTIAAAQADSALRKSNRRFTVLIFFIWIAGIVLIGLIGLGIRSVPVNQCDSHATTAPPKAAISPPSAAPNKAAR